MIGAGAIAPYHCKAINEHPRAEVVAVADSSPRRANALKREFKMQRVYAKVDDLIADPDIDAVSIALPTYLHAPVTIAALGAGKHVMLDKPFAMNQKEAVRIIAAAKKSRKVLTVGMNQRFTRQAQTIRALKERGELGQIYHGKAYWRRRSGSPRFGTWFCQKSKSGGGCLLDIGVHMLDLCLSIMGNFRAEAVSGAAYTKFGNRGLGEGGWGKSDRGRRVFNVDDLAGALIKLRGGASVILEVSWARHQEVHNRHNVELFGAEAGAQVFPPRLFRFGKKKGEYEVVEPQGVAIAYPHCDRLQNWIDAILGEAKIECTLDQSLAIQKIIDGIYQSAKTGRETRIRS